FLPWHPGRRQDRIRQWRERGRRRRGAASRGRRGWYRGGPRGGLVLRRLGHALPPFLVSRRPVHHVDVDTAIRVDSIEEDVVGDVLTAPVAVVGEVLSQGVARGGSAGGEDQ